MPHCIESRPESTRPARRFAAHHVRGGRAGYTKPARRGYIGWMATPRQLVDRYGREIKDLRISITDRCNFRCSYCMPEEGTEWLPRNELLSFEEILALARVFTTAFHVESIRLTGGEPTVRAQLPRLIKLLAGLRTHSGGPVDLSMTTNGATLSILADELRRAGLRRLNISLDTLDRAKFSSITKRDRLDQVLAGIDAAIGAGFEVVKINAVAMRGINDDELIDFAGFAREKGVTVRFIEFMPLDGGGMWTAQSVLTTQEIVDTISSRYPLEALPRTHAPATRYRFLDGQGEIGVIPSVTQPFCGDCDRVRLSAEGQLRTCLFAHQEHDLKALLRSGATEEEMADRIEQIVDTKWAGHSIGRVNFLRPSKTMSQIGG